jgi:hypothetical protein
MSKWKDIVGAVAPVLGTALGGPMGGMAARVVSQALLGKESASERELEQALMGASPEQLMQLKQAEIEFEQRMRELDIDLERLHQQDRDSARRRETEVGGWATPVLATVVIAGFFGATFAALMGYSEVDSALAGTLVGFVAAKAEQVVSYYFGSSAGSAAKNKMLDKK